MVANLTDQRPAVTWPLVIDVIDALAEHGHRYRDSDSDVGAAVLMIGDLAATYTGDRR